MTTATIIATLSVIAGLGTTIKALRVVDTLRKYELRHGTPGGIQFPTYEASKRHHFNKSLWSLMAAAGTAAIVIGVLLFLR